MIILINKTELVSEALKFYIYQILEFLVNDHKILALFYLKVGEGAIVWWVIAPSPMVATAVFFIFLKLTLLNIDTRAHSTCI